MFDKKNVVPLVLLDSNLPENTLFTQKLTDQLYKSDNPEWRLLQRLVLTSPAAIRGRCRPGNGLQQLMGLGKRTGSSFPRANTLSFTHGCSECRTDWG